MKKRVKLPIIITASVLAAILVAVVIMCAIIIRPFSKISDYKYVDFYTSAAKDPLPSIVNNDDDKAAFEKALKDSGFSSMHAFLEWQFGYGFNIVTEKNEKGDKVNVEVLGKNIKDKLEATEGNYVLEFVYRNDDNEPLKTLKVGKQNIEFDRLITSISTSNGEITTITLYPYIYEKTVGVSPDVENYKINPISIKANTTSLFNTLKNIAEKYI